jgi:hypothetical protein
VITSIAFGEKINTNKTSQKKKEKEKSMHTKWL